jgi:class 3 adenylate cyclase/Tol biopolymer transport system component
MADSEGTRRLEVILAADVAGYSRLMGDDEAATVRTLTEYRQVFSGHIARHGGRIVDTAGDSVLAVCDSAVEAVECAIDIQKVLERRNRQLADHRRMQFRIGINLGDVITRSDGSIYGDGVNIAARLQALADPGGICVSGAVYDQVEGKLPLSLNFAGEQSVKNIAKPVRAYHVAMDAAATAPPASNAAIEGRSRLSDVGESTSGRSHRALARLVSPPVTMALVFLVALMSGAAISIWLRGSTPGTATSVRRATIYLSGQGDTHARNYALYQTPWFALSIDGLLVYAPQGSTGPLLARRLDASAAHPVDGTTGGVSPFLSPDGQMLGFEREGGIFTVPISGGQTSQVKDVVFRAWTGGRPAWTPDGRIIYTSERGALVMVRADGTSSEQLTTPPEGTQDLSPVVLPDGRTLLFTEIAGSLSEARIVALSLTERRPRPLISGGALTPQYADGFLFYCRPNGTLIAVPFDAARVEVTGQERALPDRVDHSRFGIAHYVAAPGVLVYSPYAQTRLVEMDRAGRVTILTDEGRWHMPRYSPDGTRLVFDRVTGEGAERDVWTLARGDKTLSRVTRVGDAHDPTWLPNGKEISFLSFKTPGGPLMISASDGSGEPQAVPVTGPFKPSALVNPGVWLSDGSYLGGVVERTGNSDIWRLPRDGVAAVKVVGGPYNEHSPTVSADGRWLAYQSNETGRPEVYVRPLSHPEGRLQVSSAGGTAPVWDKRTLTLYYLEADGARLHLVGALIRTSQAPAIVSRTVVLTDVRLEDVENHPNYDADPSGTNFVMPEQTPTGGLAAIFDVAASLQTGESHRK